MYERVGVVEDGWCVRGFVENGSGKQVSTNVGKGRGGRVEEVEGWKG